MQVDQGILDMLKGPDRGSASVGVSANPVQGDKCMKTPHPINKECEKNKQKSKQSENVPMQQGSTTRPEGEGVS